MAALDARPTPQRLGFLAGASSRQNLERRDVSRSDYGEVAPVERCNDVCAKAFGRGYDRRIHCTEGKVVVCGDQLRDADPVNGKNRFCEKVAGCEISQEADLSGPAEARLEEIGNFRHDELRHDEWTFV